MVMHGYGSPGPERIHQSESEREGQPFDHSHLKDYKQTVYNYELPGGLLLYQQCRYDDARERAGVDERKKRLLPRRPYEYKPGTPKDEQFHRWVFGPGQRRVIFNWPAIIKAGPPGPVFVCQGEKNASDLIKLNLLATTVISAKWTDECIGALAGCELFILEDNDEPGRREAARTEQWRCPLLVEFFLLFGAGRLPAPWLVVVLQDEQLTACQGTDALIIPLGADHCGGEQVELDQVAGVLLTLADEHSSQEAQP